MLYCFTVEHFKGEKALINLRLCFSSSVLPPAVLSSPGVCFVFPARSSRSSSCPSWSPRSTERGSSPLFPLAHFCPTFPPSKSAFPQRSSMKNTSGHLARRCPRPQAQSGMERPTDTHDGMKPNTSNKIHTIKTENRPWRFGRNISSVNCADCLSLLKHVLIVSPVVRLNFFYKLS